MRGEEGGFGGRMVGLGSLGGGDVGRGALGAWRCPQTGCGRPSGWGWGWGGGEEVTGEEGGFGGRTVGLGSLGGGDVGGGRWALGGAPKQAVVAHLNGDADGGGGMDEEVRGEEGGIWGGVWGQNGGVGVVGGGRR